MNATSSRQPMPRVPDMTAITSVTSIERTGPRQDYALFNLIALALGAILGLVHVPFPASWLLPIPLALVMLLILEQPTAKDSSRVGFFAGLGFWAIHLFWLPKSFAGVFPGAAVLIWALMPLVWVIEAGFWALLVWISVRITPYHWARLGVLCSGFVILEWLRSLGPLAFPWGNFGYALIDTPLAQLAAFGGVYLESVLVLLMAAGIVSTVPLLCFTAAARRLPYSTVGMIQFLAPTLQFALAVGLYGEPFTLAHAIAFGAIWTALALYASSLVGSRHKASDASELGEARIA